MYFTGYHGTSSSNAHIIYNEKAFSISKGNKEWLGSGIYFYDEYQDALCWASDRYDIDGDIIHAIIKIKENEYIDFDTYIGKCYLREIIDTLHNEFDIQLNGTTQENQCAIMNYIWSSDDSIKLLIASFPKEPSKVKLLLDVREQRRELCVRDNTSIISVQILERVM
ncbi:MAG: hypothetical protein AB9835_12370 [Eubacteriales bacterium]